MTPKEATAGANVSRVYMWEQIRNAEKERSTFKKQGVYRTRALEVGDEVVTIVNGREETRNTAKGDGARAVEGTQGEWNVVEKDMLDKRYTPTGETEREYGILLQNYGARGFVRAVQNRVPVDEVVIDPPWEGEPEKSGSDCYYAVPCDEHGEPLPGQEPYLIDRVSFDNTYKPYQLTSDK